MSILDLTNGLPIRSFEPGADVIEQGVVSGIMLILLAGEVEVLRDGIRVAKAVEPGAVFGEMAVLLGIPCTATVRTLKPSRFAVVSEPEKFLAASPEASLHVARLLAKRIDALNSYLIDVKRQYEGHDHLGMVDDVLEALMHRQPRPAVHPPAEAAGA